MANSHSQVTPLLVDYRNNDELIEKINLTMKQNGEIDLAVAWIHSIAENALQTILNEISKGTNSLSLFHLLGSRSNLDDIKNTIEIPANCTYYQVQLGFISEGSQSRWLTHKEISDGVIDAMEKKEEVLLVGQVEPWEKRPN